MEKEEKFHKEMQKLEKLHEEQHKWNENKIMNSKLHTHALGGRKFFITLNECID